VRSAAPAVWRAWAAGLGVLLLAGFIVLGVLVGARPLPWDFDVRDAFVGEHQGPLGPAVTVVSDILGPVLPALLGVSLLVAALLCHRRGDRARASVLLRITAVLVLCRLTSFVFKPLFDRDRPRIYPDLSYPSGHVVSVATFSVGVLLLCAWFTAGLLRWAVPAVMLLTVAAAALRLVLGVHWLTDTIGAALAVTGVGLVTSAAFGLLPAGRDRETSRAQPA